MAFSKAVLLVVFAVLLISSVVSAHGDLAETTNTPTTDNDGRGLYPGVAIGGNRGRSMPCDKKKSVSCNRSGGKGGNGVPNCKNNPNTRECYRGGNGGNGGKGGRAGYGPENEN